MSDKRNAAGSKKDQLKGAIAQLGERLPCTQEVSGSIPLGSTSTAAATDTPLDQSSYMNHPLVL